MTQEQKDVEKQLIFDTKREFKKGDKQLLAYDYIKKAIVTNVYEAHQQLNEKELSEVLGGMSRTPIRDALRRLTYEGLIENYPGRGMFVAEVSIKDLLEISELRVPLESTATELFTQRASNGAVEELLNTLKNHEDLFNKKDYIGAVECDNEFHFVISKGTMNSRLENTINQLIEESSRGAFLTKFDVNRVEASIVQHKLIFEAIKENNAELAGKRMTEHLQEWIEYIKDLHVNKFFLFNK